MITSISDIDYAISVAASLLKCCPELLKLICSISRSKDEVRIFPLGFSETMDSSRFSQQETFVFLLFNTISYKYFVKYRFYKCSRNWKTRSSIFCHNFKPFTIQFNTCLRILLIELF